MTAGFRIIRGSAKILAAELLVFPSGLITVTYLTRTLGPYQFGLFTLSAAVVAWIEWSVNAFFSRSSVRLTGETEDWKPVAGSIVKLGWIVSSLVALGLALCASGIAGLLGDPKLAAILRWFAIDIPFWIFAQMYRAFAVGRESYSVRSRLAMARWTLRPIFIVGLVSAFHTPVAAVMGWIAATCFEALLCRVWFPLPGSSASPWKVWPRLLQFAAPLTAFGIIMRFFDKIDLFMLKTLGASTAMAGIYGAAQGISLAPGVMTMSLAPLLLGTITRGVAKGQSEEVRGLSQNAIRFLVLLFPGVFIAGMFSDQIVLIVFGHDFLAAGKILRILLISAYFTSVISLCSAILTAFGRPGLPLWFVLPMLPMAFAGNLWMIPRFGPAGAAAVSACVAAGCAFPLLIVTYRAAIADNKSGRSSM